MAGSGSRTLKLSILADVDQLKKSLTAGGSEVESFGTKLGGFGKVAGAAFLAAGVAAAAYAGKLLIDGVQSAIADEAAQIRLANALKNVVGATDDGVKSVESWILKTSLAKGATDDELRPAFERLTRSTKDIAEAQNLTNLALDIAAAKNISVETAANALAKANDGNVNALKKLGITLGENATNLVSYNQEQAKLSKLLAEQDLVLETSGAKSKEYAAITAKIAEKQELVNKLGLAGIDVFGELGKEFSGAATEAAETFAGKMDRLKIAFEEGKETIGSFVLDAITPMLTIFLEKVVPAIQQLSNEIGPILTPIFKGISTFITETFIPAFSALYLFIKDKVVPIFVTAFKPAIEGIKTVFVALDKAISDNGNSFDGLKLALGALLIVAKLVAPFIGGAFKLAFSGVALIIDGVSIAARGIVSAINAVISGVNALIAAYNIVNNIIPGSKDIASIPKRAMGGQVSSNNPYIVGELGPELFVPSSSGKIVPNNQISSGGGATFNITVNGAIDAEGTARSIIDVLNNSFYRGTGGATAFAS